MFMDNRALLDQLMGKDRNAPTFKGITEQWKDPSICKPYILDFCPYETLQNTKVTIGSCRLTHSDVVRQQFECSLDKEKASLQKKYELDLLTHLERIVDNIDTRVRKQSDRIRVSNQADLTLPHEKQKALSEMNEEISVCMKQVERLAEQGMFDDSSSLMSKVEELTKRATEFKQQAEARYFKRETVCQICSAVTVFNASGEGKDELINEHLRGRQHTGLELIRLKVIEIKNKHRIHLARRDREFEPSEGVKKQLEKEGVKLVVSLHSEDSEEEQRPSSRVSSPRNTRIPASSSGPVRGRPYERPGKSGRSRSPRRPRSPSTPRSMVSVTFD